ncbi:MAG: hypothetical protein JZD40_00160, partial [Sulfolobus sp.]|nr:hypothetical protein [Sulfolobus sp.]
MGIIENFKLVYKNKDLRLLLLSRPLLTYILQTEILPIFLFKSNIIQENVFLQSILLIFFMNIIPIADMTSFVMDYVRNIQRFRLYLLFVSSIPLFLIGIILLSFYNNLTLPIFFLILALQSVTIFSVRYNGVLIFPAFKKFNEEKVFFAISQVNELFLQTTFALGALIVFLIGLYGVKVLAIFYLLSGIYEAITNGIRLRVHVESRDKTGISISKQAFKEYFNLTKNNKRFFYIVFLL